MTKRVSAMDVRKNLGSLLNIVSLRNEEIIIERAGKEIAKLVPCNHSNSRENEKLDFRKSRGLGKLLWKKIKVEKYVAEEREQWD